MNTLHKPPPMYAVRRQKLAQTTNTHSLKQAKAIARRRIDDALTIGWHLLAASWQVDHDLIAERLDALLLGAYTLKEAA